MKYGYRKLILSNLSYNLALRLRRIYYYYYSIKNKIGPFYLLDFSDEVLPLTDVFKNPKCFPKTDLP